MRTRALRQPQPGSRRGSRCTARASRPRRAMWMALRDPVRRPLHVEGVHDLSGDPPREVLERRVLDALVPREPAVAEFLEDVVREQLVVLVAPLVARGPHDDLGHARGRRRPSIARPVVPGLVGAVGPRVPLAVRRVHQPDRVREVTVGLAGLGCADVAFPDGRNPVSGAPLGFDERELRSDADEHPARQEPPTEADLDGPQRHRPGSGGVGFAIGPHHAVQRAEVGRTTVPVELRQLEEQLFLGRPGCRLGARCQAIVVPDTAPLHPGVLGVGGRDDVDVGVVPGEGFTHRGDGAVRHGADFLCGEGDVLEGGVRQRSRLRVLR